MSADVIDAAVSADGKAKMKLVYSYSSDMNAGTSRWYEFKRWWRNLLQTLRPVLTHFQKKQGTLGARLFDSRKGNEGTTANEWVEAWECVQFQLQDSEQQRLVSNSSFQADFWKQTQRPPLSNPQIMQGTGLKKTRFSYVNCSLSYGRTHQRATNLRVIHTQSAKFSIARTLWFEVGYPAFTNTIPALMMVFSLWRHFT